MPPKVKKEEVTPVAPEVTDETSQDVKKVSKKAAEPKRTSVKTANGVEIGWVEG